METKLAFLLREHIEAAYGGNQSEFSRATGFTPQATSAWLKGKVTLPQIDARRRLARELGISHVDLLIAAGELTRDEAVSGGIQQRDELSGIPPQVVTALGKIRAWTSWHTTQMLRQVDNMIELEGLINQSFIDAVESVGGHLGEGGEIQFPNIEPRDDKGGILNGS